MIWLLLILSIILFIAVFLDYSEMNSERRHYGMYLENFCYYIDEHNQVVQLLNLKRTRGIEFRIRVIMNLDDNTYLRYYRSYTHVRFSKRLGLFETEAKLVDYVKREYPEAFV